MTPNPSQLASEIKAVGKRLGFQQIGITNTALGEDALHLQRWLSMGRQGTMDYMGRHGSKRWKPDQLVPGTLRVISARMDYWPDAAPIDDVLAQRTRAFVSRYALGRDYHKVLRGRLQRLSESVQRLVGPFGYRVFVDSAPVLEKALARNAGLGTHQPNQQGRRLLVFPRRDLHRPPPADRRPSKQPLRQLQRLYGRLPHPSHCGTL